MNFYYFETAFYEFVVEALILRFNLLKQRIFINSHDMWCCSIVNRVILVSVRTFWVRLRVYYGFIIWFLWCEEGACFSIWRLEWCCKLRLRILNLSLWYRGVFWIVRWILDYGGQSHVFEFYKFCFRRKVKRVLMVRCNWFEHFFYLGIVYLNFLINIL